MNASAVPRSDHQVWEVYDLLRRSRLNVYYFTAKLGKARHAETVSDIALACVVPGSAVAGLPVWHDGTGGYLWGVVTAIAALLAVAKPFLKFSDKAQAYQSAVTRYQIVAGELSELRTIISQRQSYDDDLQERFQQVAKNATAAESSEPTEPVDENLRYQVYERVRKEIPGGSFFVPKGP